MYLFFRICSGFLFCFVFLNHPFSAADTTMEVENAAAAEFVNPLKPLQIKLSVEEVRLDVVVLDSKGNPVTDLKASDFMVSQNGRRQNILSSVYVENQLDAAAQPSATRKDPRSLPILPTVNLKREDTGRAIIFVIDDLSMSFQNVYHARMSLRNFVEKQMQTGDMVAILRTGHGNSALQMFLSDKGQVLVRIDGMRMETAQLPYPDGSHLYRVYDNQLSTLNYSLRALKDMPGRKILVMVTAIPSIRKPDNTSLFIERSDTAPIDKIDFHDLYFGRFSRLSDDALRAGVVVNYLNIGGLDPFNTAHTASGGRLLLSQEDAIDRVVEITHIHAPPQVREQMKEKIKGDIQRGYPLPNEVQRAMEALFPEEMEKERNMSSLNALNPLPAKTGGIIIENSNFFLDGIGRDVENLMKGYYLVSYEPPEGTFSSGDKEIFNQIKVNVSRRNVQVHTRDGFYNRIESEADAAAPPAHPLQNAIFSPFLYSDLDVNIAAGYIKDAKAGYLVRSWIHLDPKDVMIIETEDGGARIDLETVCLTSDINGFVQDLVDKKYTFKIEPEKKSENLAWIQKHGIRFAMLLPVKKPGSYYVRTAVRDTESGKVGSAYQYVEIPDLDKKGLALSDMFIVSNAEDLNWMRSDVAKESASGMFSPTFQGEEVRSPALRNCSEIN